MFMPTGQTNQALFKLNNNKNTGEDKYVLNLSQVYILKPWSIAFTSKFKQVQISLLAYSLFVPAVIEYILACWIPYKGPTFVYPMARYQ